VENRIITNWEYQDKQSHLKTIRDRLLKDDEKAVRLLGLYQRVLQGAELSGDNLPERMALLLTGLVISEQERLFPYNEIYRRVFSDEWVVQELAKLRPYAESLQLWLANSRDSKYLLTGQGFLDAQQWSLNRLLMEEDSQYLAASRKLHTEDVQATADAIIGQTKSEAAQITKRAKKKATLFTTIGVSSLVVSMVASGVAWLNFNEVIWRTNIEQANTEALINLPKSSLDRSIAVMKIGRDLQRKVKNTHLNNYPTYSPLSSLRETIGSYWHESNFLPTHPSLVKVDGKIVNNTEFNAVAVSADGQIIISAESKDKIAIIKVWRRDGSLISTMKAGRERFINSIAVSADGKTIVFTGEYTRYNNGAIKDETIEVWRQDGSLITTLRGHRGSINAVAVSADGQTIVSGSTDKTVKVWRQDGSLITTLTGHNAVTGIAVSADGQTIVSGSLDGTLRVWQTNNSKVMSFRTDQFGVESVAVSADGQTIVSGSFDGTVKVLQRDGSLTSTLEDHDSAVKKVAISADSKTIVSSNFKGIVKVWQKSGRGIFSPVATLNGRHPLAMDVDSIAISADGKTIVSISWDKSVNRSKNNIIKIWRQDGFLIDTPKNRREFVGEIAVSADGQTIVSGSYDKTARGSTVEVSRKDGSFISTIESHQKDINSIAVSADGQTIISGSRDKTVKVWRRDGSLITALTGHRDSIHAVAVSADGQTIVSGSLDKTVKVWRQDGSLITTLTGHIGMVTGVAVSADGQTIVSGSTDSTLRVWQMNNSKVTSFPTDQWGLYSVAVSADGQTIVSGGLDKTVKVWRQDGSLISSTLEGSKEAGRVGISADGQTIVSNSSDKMIKVWRQDGSTIATLPTNSYSQSLGISADGKTIVTGNSDNTIKIWHFDLDYLLAKGCEQLKDYLDTHPEVNREEICPK
jgi:WD40 repeat protein